MLFPRRLSKVIMRSKIQSMHQMSIIHSDIGHCWLAIIVRYLLPLPFNILYIAPVFMIGTTVQRLLKGRDISALAAWPDSHFSTFWVFSRGNWNISSWRNRCNKSEMAVECHLNVDWIEIHRISTEVAVGAISWLLWVENLIWNDKA